MTVQDLFSNVLRALNLAKIGGKTTSITPTITTSAGAYTSGDNVGGILTIPNAVISASGTGILKSIVVKDNANQSAALTILLFSSDPTSGMTATDNSAFAWGATSFPKCIGKFLIAATDYTSADSKSVANVDTMSSPFQANGGTSLYAVIVTTGTPTYAANATTLYVTFNFLQD